MKVFPLPNALGKDHTYNYQYEFAPADKRNDQTFRVDYNISTSWRVSFRALLNERPRLQSAGLNVNNVIGISPFLAEHGRQGLLRKPHHDHHPDDDQRVQLRQHAQLAAERCPAGQQVPPSEQPASPFHCSIRERMPGTSRTWFSSIDIAIHRRSCSPGSRTTTETPPSTRRTT